MISIPYALLLGAVQGIAEWLPISSSGHLAIVGHYMGLGTPIAFDVFLHLASVCILLVFLRKQVVDIIRAVIRLDFRSAPGRMFLFIVAGSIPTAILGFAFENRFEAMFSRMNEVGVGLIFTAFLLILSRFGSEKRELDWGRSFLIGIFQGIAIAPGVSRSGATIGSALFSGLKREEAVYYSFLLAIPAILGASAFKARDLVLSDVSAVSLIVGCFTALITGYLTLILLKKIVMQRKISWFAIYCFGLGVALIIID